MQEESKNTVDIDPSGMFSTYKAHPDKNQAPFVPEMYAIPVKNKEQNKSDEPATVKAIRIIVDGIVRIIKIAVWSMAIFGGLFIAALATNTIDRAVNILNTNIGTRISISGEVDVVSEKLKETSGLTSNSLSPLPADITPEAIAKKRRAILEAKKAAKILEEKKQALEQSIQ